MTEEINMDDTYWWKKSLKNRVLNRQRRYNASVEKLLNIIEAGRIDREPYPEIERRWLDTFAPEGKEGLNLCCGNIPIGESLGVDKQWHLLAVNEKMDLDDLYKFQEKVDYIVSNHIESSVNPSRFFFTVRNMLKPGGVFACVFVNSDAPAKDINDVCMSPKKSTLFNRSTMEYYLRKAEFKTVEVTDSSTPILLRAVGRV